MISVLSPRPSVWQRVHVSNISRQDYFTYLTREGHYDSARTADQGALLYVFLPIIQREIQQFIEAHNARSIRKQRQRSNNIAGVPDEIYEGIRGARLPESFRETQYGQAFDEDMARDSLRLLDDFGKSYDQLVD